MNLLLVSLMMLTVPSADWAASGATPAAFAARDQFVAAKLGLEQSTVDCGRLEIVKHFDIVWQNCRVDRPLTLGAREFRRGLFTHAPSDIRVCLPGAGATFTAILGVDSNSQTRGGQGSVVFSITRDGATELFRSEVVREGQAGVPIRVDLHGATEFHLQVSDGGDGVSCDQAVWIDPVVTLADDHTIHVSDLPITDAPWATPYSQGLPFSFMYGEKPFSDLVAQFKTNSSTRELDANRLEKVTVFTDPATGLEVRWTAVIYRDYPIVEWTLHFKNNGQADTPLISDIQALDLRVARLGDDVYTRFARPSEFVLHHQTGSICVPEDYEPHATPLKAGAALDITPLGGRGSNGAFPYFNVAWPGEGLIAVVGWPGQWKASFARDTPSSLRLTAGQERTHFVLHPGEEVRSPLVVLQFWKGDRIDSQNVWRRWMIAHNVPRPAGKLQGFHLSGCSSHFFNEMVTADEASQIEFIDRYRAEQIPIDYWWMDAGWYVNKTGWPHTGTWEVDTKRFPRGLRAITDHAHQHNIRSIVWFEPERVMPDTWLTNKHPEWLLGKPGETQLLDLGNPEAWQWLVNHVDQLITEQGIDLYRQDFNMDPLDYWRQHDAPDRQGITEIGHVTGYLAYWDELLRRHPGLLIDTCASGGRRNDLETLRRAVPLWRTDYILEPVGTQCCTYGISFWIPFHGTGVKDADPYLFRSMMSPYPNCLWDARRTDLNYDELRRLTSQWRAVADCYAGDYYPLTDYSLSRTDWIGWQFHRPDTGKGMIQVFRRENSIYRAVDMTLRGLDPEATYRVTDQDRPAEPREIRGQALLEQGLPVEITTRPGSVLFTYERVD